ncbi:MAG: PQQ-binding-like beta-propeller repeat protein [Pseudomonadota bacterium]|nr:PQQ-binding-like beta-propeller repeat protein [Pseudomonadota bacterium]
MSGSWTAGLRMGRLPTTQPQTPGSRTSGSRQPAPAGKACVRLAAAAALLFAAGVRAQPPGAPEKNICLEAASPVALGSAQWNGWGRDVENTRYQPEPAIRATDVPKLALKWAFGFQDSTVVGQPTVVDERLFVVSSTGRVYSLDAKTGCIYWTFNIGAGARTAITIGESAPPRNAVAPRLVSARRKHGNSKRPKHQLTLAHLDILKAPSDAFVGDDTGAVYALDAQKGTLLWKTQVDAHPQARIVGAPTLYRGRLYVVVGSNERSAAANEAYECCTFRGSIAALDMATGQVLWKTYALTQEPRASGTTAAGRQQYGPAGGAIAAAPTIDGKRNLIYVSTGSSLTDIDQPRTDAVLALDVSDGQVRWTKQFPRHDKTEAGDFLSSPILRTLADGRQIIVAGQKSGLVYALDPDRGGDVLWQTKAADEGLPAGIEWGFAADHVRLYVALSGLVAEPENASGGLVALEMKTGARRWYTPAPTPACSWGAQACYHAQAQAVTVIPGAAFSGSMDGHLRAYSTINGKVIWDYDTAKDFPTVNGVRANGGSLDQGGATIVNGVVYVYSGYGQRSGQPGNVLLAFSVDGK